MTDSKAKRKDRAPLTPEQASSAKAKHDDVMARIDELIGERGC